MFLLHKHNHSFGCPEFLREDSGSTLHPSKALAVNTFEEGLDLLKFHQEYSLVAVEDIDRLPGVYN